jgi:hypothetical protein
MERILAGLALTLVVAFAVPLAVLRAGTRQQERAASLTCRPRGLSAAIARRVFGLYAHRPDTTATPAARPQHAEDEPPLASRRNGPAL